jgi:hypothetical protein
MSTVIGGAMLPHALQFFTAGHRGQRGRCSQKVAAESARSCAQAGPVVIFSNDHAEQFSHRLPPFTVHVGGEATGESPAGSP